MPENIDPEQLKFLLSPKPADFLLQPREKEDSSKILAIKFSEKEVSTIRDLEIFLLDRGYVPDDSFESLFFYLINLAASLHKKWVMHEIEMERTLNLKDSATKSIDSQG